MKKKIISLILCIVMVTSLLPAVAYAEDAASGDGWYLDTDGCLHITGAVENPSFTDENGTANDNTPWKDRKSEIFSVVTEPGSSVDSGCALFFGCNNLIYADLSNLDTSDVTDMGYMFRYCRELSAVDLTGLDTSKTENMGCMFQDCRALTSLDVSGFDTSSAVKMWSMFSYCSSLGSLDVSGFDTSNAEHMNDMFRGCKSLTSLDLSSFDISKAASAEDFSTNTCRNIFAGCYNLSDITVNGDMLSPNADILYEEIYPRWKNKETGALYGSAEELKAISGKVTLTRNTALHIADADGWYIDGDGCLHLTGFVKNTCASGINTSNRTFLGYEKYILKVVAERCAFIYARFAILMHIIITLHRCLCSFQN